MYLPYFEIKYTNNDEEWKVIENFNKYEISNGGIVRNRNSGHILSNQVNHGGHLSVLLSTDKGSILRRSTSLLVAKEFLGLHSNLYFDTPIHLNGNKTDARAINLLWRPYWYAVKFHKQFGVRTKPEPKQHIMDMISHEKYRNIYDCSEKTGLLESEIINSIISGAHTFPTKQKFIILPRDLHLK